jgi:inosine-uridine nucleoside N-ribohydrolase
VSGSARPLLFDTDIGSDCDDAVALGLILHSPDALELVAVTTVSARPRERARIAASLLGLADRRDVEVCVGAAAGLTRPADAYNWFGHEERCVADAPPATISDEPAAERIVRAARENPGLEIAAVGPLTNLAHALALDPELPRRVSGVTVMGGHVRQALLGDFVCPFGVDYNLCSDPEASVAVLDAGFRTTLVTADVTLQTWLTSGDLAALEAAGPLARELARQVRIWTPVQRGIFTGLGGTLEDDNVAFLHDPLTVLACIDGRSLGFETLGIRTAVEGGTLRTREVARGRAMRVATAVDAVAARRAIVDRLLRPRSAERRAS